MYGLWSMFMELKERLRWVCVYVKERLEIRGAWGASQDPSRFYTRVTQFIHSKHYMGSSYSNNSKIRIPRYF